ncbi:biopolymer transporter ExbD [Pseudosulfitobacter pseudonitzschiae]|uniref:ExbD/TolR family protein n=1 Tax=Pseudosulfitobacter pseudonitzschiae TaxID=1402135 RepID=UPI002ED9FAE0
MLDFSPATPPRRPAENIVPMINVVFLLLIFFLMSAQIAPPDPIDVTVPDSTSEAAPLDPDALYVGADGMLAYGGATGDAALAALSGHQGVLPLRADAALPATKLAALLPKLAAAGVDGVELITGAK